MDNVIEIDLDNRDEYVNEYNDGRINERMQQYILDYPINMKQDIVLKLNFNYKAKVDDIKFAEKMIKLSFSSSLSSIETKLKKLNYRDFTLLLLGILFLLIYCYLDKIKVFLFAEIFLIIGWVAFWEIAESLLFYRKKLVWSRRKYQKLMLAKIEIGNK